MTVRILLNAYVEAPEFPEYVLDALEQAKAHSIRRGHLILRYIKGRDRKFGFERLCFDVLVVFDQENIDAEVDYLRNMIQVILDQFNVSFSETWVDRYSNTEADTLREQLKDTIRHL